MPKEQSVSINRSLAAEYKNLAISEIAAYLFLHFRAVDRDKHVILATVGIKEMSNITGWSRNTVRKALKGLIRKGYINQVGEGFWHILNTK